jgi:hypothetical protein
MSTLGQMYLLFWKDDVMTLLSKPEQWRPRDTKGIHGRVRLSAAAWEGAVHISQSS